MLCSRSSMAAARADNDERRKCNAAHTSPLPPSLSSASGAPQLQGPPKGGADGLVVDSKNSSITANTHTHTSIQFIVGTAIAHQGM